MGPQYGFDEKTARQIQGTYLFIKRLESGSQFWPSGTDYYFTVKEALLHGAFLKAAIAEARINGAVLDEKAIERLVVQEALRVYGARIQEYANDFDNFRDLVLKGIFPHELVEELSTAVIEEQGMVKALGGVPVISTGRNVSGEAVDLRYRLTLVSGIVKTLSSVIRGWQAGKMVSMVGETGVAKTTMGVFLAQLMGLEHYIYSTHGESKARDLTLALKRQESGGYSLVVQEFLRRIEKGNQVIILDEANIRPEILWVLNGIARGEKEITVEMPGEESHTVKVGDNVFFLLTMNPESYAGRGQIPEVLLENVFKLWAPSDYTTDQLEKIFDDFLRFMNQESIQKRLSLTQVQGTLGEAVSRLTIDQLLQTIEEKGQRGLRGFPRQELKELEQEILSLPDVKKKIKSIRTAVAVEAPDIKLIFTLRGWWAQSMDGKRITVPLYELVDPKRSQKAVVGLIIHELRHKRFSPTTEEMKQIAQELGLEAAILDPQFHNFWNAFEDLRIDHIRDPELLGHNDYIESMNDEFFRQPMTEGKKAKMIKVASQNPAGAFLNEVLAYGYSKPGQRHNSEIFSSLPQEVQDAVNAVIGENEGSLLYQASFQPAIVPDFNFIQQSRDEREVSVRTQEEKIRAAKESLRVMAEKIFPIYKSLAAKSQGEKGEVSGFDTSGVPIFIQISEEEMQELLEDLPQIAIPESLRPQTSGEEKGQEGGTLQIILLENTKPQGTTPKPKFMTDEDRQKDEEAVESMIEQARQERQKQMASGERFNLRLSEVSQFGKRLAKGLIELFRVPEEPDIEESATGMIINPIRYLLRNQEPFDEEVESLGKPNLALGVTIDTSGSMSGYRPALKKMLAIMMSAFEQIGKKKAEYSISFIHEEFDPIKGFRDRYSSNDLNQKQEKMEEWMDEGGRPADEGGARHGQGGGIHLFNAVSGIIEKYKKTDMKNKLELVLTDGQDTGGDLSYDGTGKPIPSGRLKKKLDEAKKLGIEIIGVGFNTRDTEIFGEGHYIQLNAENAESIVDAVLKIAKIKVQRGQLPKTDLSKLLGTSLSRAVENYQRTQEVSERKTSSDSELAKVVEKAVINGVGMADNAAVAPATGPGGIDLTPASMNLQTQSNGGEIKFYIDPAMLQKFKNAPGFVPVIINVQPMTDLYAFLGIDTTKNLLVNS